MNLSDAEGEARPTAAGETGAPRSHKADSRILSVEIGRGLAALAVVFFHANVGSRSVGGIYMPWMSVFEHGVDFFFVLSGFIIYTAHVGDIGRSGQVAAYLKKRCIRLFPLLWAIALGYVLLRIATGDATDMATLVRSLIPYPSLASPAPLVIWTLRHELLFYLIFGLVIWLPRLGWGVMALWTVASLAQMAVIVAGGTGAGGGASLVLSSFTLDFIMGIGVAMAYRRYTFAPRRWPLLAALMGLALVLALTQIFDFKRESFSDYLSLPAILWTPVLGAAFAAIVIGLLHIEPYISRRELRHGWFLKLGAASYAVYLVHTPVNGALLRMLQHLPASWAKWGGALLLLVVVGVAAGFVLHIYFERPLAFWLRRRFVPARANLTTPDRSVAVPVAHAKRIADTIR